MTTPSCLAQLAAGLSGLSGVNQLSLAAVAAGLQLRSLHGQRFWCGSSEQQCAAAHGVRFLAAQPNYMLQEQDAVSNETLSGSSPSSYSSRSRRRRSRSTTVQQAAQIDGPLAATEPLAGKVAQAAVGIVDADTEAFVASTRIRSRRKQAEAASSTCSAEANSLPDHHISSEGDVMYPERQPLLRTIERHWEKLQMCPSAAAYTQQVSFDEFGHRYIQQLEREERSRNRALEQLHKEIAAEAKHGASYSKSGGVAKLLVSAWVPLLAQAIQEEQQQVLRADRAAAQRRDRPNYGPYLLLLSPTDLAHITLQTVLSRVVTAMPDTDSAADATAVSLSPSGTGISANSSSGGSSYELSSRGSSSSSSDAVMSPAVLLADSIGRTVNSRMKYLRFKHHQKEWQALQARELKQLREKAAAAAQQAGEQQQQSDSDGKLSSSLSRYNQYISKEAAEYAQGQARLQAYLAVQSIRAAAKKAAAAALADVHWDTEVRIKLGAALLALLVENTTLPSGLPGGKPKPWNKQTSSSSSSNANGNGTDVPAFEYVYVKSGLKQQAFVRASQSLVDVLLADRSLAAHLLTKVPPMLVPPEPWTGYSRGGYLTSRHWMMRTRYSAAVKQELQRGMAENKYAQVLDALNVLGNTSWKINRQVYDVMTQLWNARSTAGGLPQQQPLKPPTPPPMHYRLVFEGGALSARSGPWSRLERRAHVLASDDVRRINRNMASLKSDFLLKLRVAEEYKDAPEFYYPHTLDFRGRAYPLHPSLHHLGDDTCRGLLMFAKGVPLGQQGLDWLYVHLANVWGQGQDKLSFDGRRSFARSHLATILAVADDPLKHTWWQDAEKPWQALAACCEIAGALQSMDPASYLSHLPVHMDGSCNGLQHYAALGRDEAGGRAVNLLPSDKPQDVYKGVAEIVARRAAADAAAGVLEAQRCVSLVDRKLVKQTVMTSVYGVTPVGARAQVEARLKERRTDMKQKAQLMMEQSSSGSGHGSEQSWFVTASGMSSALPAAAAAAAASSGGGAAASAGNADPPAAAGRDEYSWMDDKDIVWQVSKYLADQTLDAIGEMFGSARAIMGWLADCARVVASSNAPVKWESPLGLPITQPYHKLDMKSIQTVTQAFTVVNNNQSEDKCQWLKARQRSAFPPNFIHSIDSTHMMLTALACSDAGITFAGVHDSFWTHAGHVPVMNKLLRDKFVELHTRQPDLLEDLVAQLQAQHPHLEFPPIPERGKLQVHRVRNSRYFFS